MGAGEARQCASQDSMTEWHAPRAGPWPDQRQGTACLGKRKLAESQEAIHRVAVGMGPSSQLLDGAAPQSRGVWEQYTRTERLGLKAQIRCSVLERRWTSPVETYHSFPA